MINEYKMLIHEMIHQVNIRFLASIIPVMRHRDEENYNGYYAFIKNITIDEKSLFGDTSYRKMHRDLKVLGFRKIKSMKYLSIFFNKELDRFLVRVYPIASISNMLKLIRYERNSEIVPVHVIKNMINDYLDNLWKAVDYMADYYTKIHYPVISIYNPYQFRDSIVLKTHDILEEIDCIARAIHKLQYFNRKHHVERGFDRIFIHSEEMIMLSILYPYIKSIISKYTEIFGEIVIDPIWRPCRKIGESEIIDAYVTKGNISELKDDPFYIISYEWSMIYQYIKMTEDRQECAIQMATIIRHITLHELMHIIVDINNEESINSKIDRAIEEKIDKLVNSCEVYLNELSCDISLKLRDLYGYSN